VIRLWEQPTEKFLKYPGLWPYAALTNTSDPMGILEEVAQKIDRMDDLRQQSNLSAISAVMGGLSLVDTPRHERTRILGSANPLKIDTLQLLAQRWFLPKREFG
jgi:hypothetical protein